jgi:hypothetical protein
MKKIALMLSCETIGDTLSAVPLIKYLYRIYEYKIPVFTHRLELLKYYPYIDLYDINDIMKYKDIYHIVNTFEVKKNIHCRMDIRQLHAKSFGIQLTPDELQVDFYGDDSIYMDLPDRYVVLHPVMNWPSRTWNIDRWDKLIESLNNEGIKVVLVGKNLSREVGLFDINKLAYKLEVGDGINFINKLDIFELWYVLNNSEVIVTMDSGILHMAGTTDSHIIQLGSSINPHFRAPYRNGSQDYKYSYIGGTCKKMCASDSMYAYKEHGGIVSIPPIPYCLDRRESIGDNNNFDIDIYRCHPEYDKVLEEIKKIME